MSSTSRQNFVGEGGLQRRIDNNIQLVMGVVLDADGNPIPGTGIPVTPTPPVGTYVTAHVANSGSTTIPTTAKRWAVNFIGTGTMNTFGTNTAVTGGQGFSDNGAPASAIAIACDGSTVADIVYSTT